MTRNNEVRVRNRRVQGQDRCKSLSIGSGDAVHRVALLDIIYERILQLARRGLEDVPGVDHLRVRKLTIQSLDGGERNIELLGNLVQSISIRNSVSLAGDVDRLADLNGIRVADLGVCGKQCGKANAIFLGDVCKSVIRYRQVCSGSWEDGTLVELGRAQTALAKRQVMNLIVFCADITVARSRDLNNDTRALGVVEVSGSRIVIGDRAVLERDLDIGRNFGIDRLSESGVVPCARII